MKLSNNPTRRLQRRRTALESFPVFAAQQPSSRRKNPRTQVQWAAEKLRLTELCTQYDVNFARSIKSKKDHSHLAKIRLGAQGAVR